MAGVCGKGGCGQEKSAEHAGSVLGPGGLLERCYDWGGTSRRAQLRWRSGAGRIDSRLTWFERPGRAPEDAGILLPAILHVRLW